MSTKELGDYLRKERERKNMSIDEIATTLKMTSTNVQNIENGNLDAIRLNDIFVKSHLKSYIKELGFNPEDLFQKFNLYDERQPVKIGTFTSTTIAFNPYLQIVSIVGFIVFMYYYIYDINNFNKYDFENFSQNTKNEIAISSTKNTEIKDETVYSDGLSIQDINREKKNLQKIIKQEETKLRQEQIYRDEQKEEENKTNTESTNTEQTNTESTNSENKNQ